MIDDDICAGKSQGFIDDFSDPVEFVDELPPEPPPVYVGQERREPRDVVSRWQWPDCGVDAALGCNTRRDYA